jgi:hypothetical protein
MVSPWGSDEFGLSIPAAATSHLPRTGTWMTYDCHTLAHTHPLPNTSQALRPSKETREQCRPPTTKSPSLPPVPILQNPQVWFHGAEQRTNLPNPAELHCRRQGVVGLHRGPCIVPRQWEPKEQHPQSQGDRQQESLLPWSANRVACTLPGTGPRRETGSQWLP